MLKFGQPIVADFAQSNNTLDPILLHVSLDNERLVQCNISFGIFDICGKRRIHTRAFSIGHNIRLYFHKIVQILLRISTRLYEIRQFLLRPESLSNERPESWVFSVMSKTCPKGHWHTRLRKILFILDLLLQRYATQHVWTVIS